MILLTASTGWCERRVEVDEGGRVGVDGGGTCEVDDGECRSDVLQLGVLLISTSISISISSFEGCTSHFCALGKHRPHATVPIRLGVRLPCACCADESARNGREREFESILVLEDVVNVRVLLRCTRVDTNTAHLYRQYICRDILACICAPSRHGPISPAPLHLTSLDPGATEPGRLKLHKASCQSGQPKTPPTSPVYAYKSLAHVSYR